MDSLTQATLGACVGVAVMGRKVGPRRAAIAGAVMGTLPDLDVFLAAADPIDSFVQHRGWSHSLFVHAAATPIIGEGLRRLFKPLHAHRSIAYGAAFLCLSTHALLDAVTVYGTRLFWPIWSEPVALGSIFIIDPLYTLPLLFAMLWALTGGQWTPRLGRVLHGAIGLSVAYLGWTAIAQQIVTDKAKAVLERHKTQPDKVLAMPTPFNTLHWRVIGIDGGRSFNLYTTVFGDPEKATLHAYGRNLDLASCATADPRTAKVAAFSRGFYRIMENNGDLVVADLRMGLTPNYAFRLVLGRLEDGTFVPGPTRRLDGRGDVATDLKWIRASILGEAAVRPAEAGARVTLAQYASAATGAAAARRC